MKVQSSSPSFRNQKARYVKSKSTNAELVSSAFDCFGFLVQLDIYFLRLIIVDITTETFQLLILSYNPGYMVKHEMMSVVESC